MKNKQPTSTDYLFVQKYICENINKTQPKATNSIFTINAIQAIDCAIRAAFECNIGSVPAYISAALKFAYKFIGQNPEKEFEAICIVNDACEEYFASLENSTPIAKSEATKFINIPYFIDHISLVGRYEKEMLFRIQGSSPSGKTSRLLENLTMMRSMFKKLDHIMPNYRWTNPNNPNENIEVFANSFTEATEKILYMLKDTVIVMVSDQDIKPIIHE